MKATEQWCCNILKSNKAAKYHESERKRVSAYNKQKKAVAVAGGPIDSAQNIMADPGEGGDGRQKAGESQRTKQTSVHKISKICHKTYPRDCNVTLCLFQEYYYFILY